MVEVEKQRVRARNTGQPKTRNRVLKYYLGDLQVCKEMFMKTLNVNDCNIGTALEKGANGYTEADKRGTTGKCR